MNSLPNPTIATTSRAEAFRCKLAGLRRDTLIKNLELILRQRDDALRRGDRTTLAWAEMRWELVWGELAARGALDVEPAA